MDLAKLPEEILAEILVRLDVKSLIRSSCVCKAWRVLIIQTPHFGDKHLKYWKNLNKKDDVVVFLRYPRGDVKYELVTYDDSQSPPFVYEGIELPFESSDRNLHVRECNGILCIAESSGSVHLCNLTTLEHLVLPPGLFEDDAVYVTENLGFGFDQSTNDYKVVRIKRVRMLSMSRKKRMLKEGLQVPGRKKCAEVYRVSTNSWSELSNVSLPLQDRICGPGVFLKGFCHWWDSTGTPFRRIVTFDFKEETFGEIITPFSSSFPYTATLDVFDDHLAVCFTKMHSAFELWVMKEFGNHGSWTRKFAIYNDDMLEPDSHWFHGSNRIVIKYPADILICPLEEKDQRFFKYDCSHLNGTSSTVFRPSLVSLRNRLPAIQP